MAIARVNGIDLHFDEHGAGDPVVMLMGTGSRGSVWNLHQVPALVAAGHHVVTVDNRGIPPTDECSNGFTVDDMVRDIAGLIEHLRIPGCSVVGTSLGAYIAAELAVARPELVKRLILMAARGRSDAMRIALARGERELRESGVELPASYRAAVQATQFLSPSTLARDADAHDWLDLLELSLKAGPGVQVQLSFEPMPDRLSAFATIRAPTLVVCFADDVVTPPHLGAELADVIDGARLEEVGSCGHYGYLEQPEAVNKLIVEFLGPE